MIFDANDRLKQDWVSAYDLCRDLARDCAEQHIWEPASRFALAGALSAHRNLALDKQDDWLNLALAYLRTCALAKADSDHEEVGLALVDLRESPTVHSSELSFFFATHLMISGKA